MTLRKRQTLEIERESTRSFFVKNWHWKSQWICRKEDCGMIQLYKPILSLCRLKWIRHLMAKPDCISPTPLYLAAKPVTSYTPPRFPRRPHPAPTACYFPWQYLLSYPFLQTAIADRLEPYESAWLPHTWYVQIQSPLNYHFLWKLNTRLQYQQQHIDSIFSLQGL
jgi:hypothetical protein